MSQVEEVRHLAYSGSNSLGQWATVVANRLGHWTTVVAIVLTAAVTAWLLQAQSQQYSCDAVS